MEKIMEKHSEFDRMNISNFELAPHRSDKTSHRAGGAHAMETELDLDNKVFKILQDVIPGRGDGSDTKSTADLWSLLVLGAVRMNCNCHCHCNCDGSTATVQNRNGKTSSFVFQTASGRRVQDQRMNDLKADFTSRLQASVKSATKAVQKTQEDNPPCKLTARELEVLKWIGRGKSTWDISVILSRSESVIKWHVKNLLQKLCAVNRPQAVAIAVRHGLID